MVIGLGKILFFDVTNAFCKFLASLRSKPVYKMAMSLRLSLCLSGLLCQQFGLVDALRSIV